VSIQVEFKDNKATGTMKMGAQEKPVSAMFGGPVFGDSPAPRKWSPLSRWRKAIPRCSAIFDLQKQKPKVSA